MSKNKINLIMRYLLVLPLLLVFVTGICATEAKAAPPIGLVEFQDCIQDEDGLECEEKMTVTVPVSFGVTQTLDAVTVTKNDGQENGTLEETVRIEITKTVPIETYPLRYLHTVAYYPHEEVIQVPHPSSGCEGCIDCWNADYPTCGWTYQGSYQIPHSQGFCIAKTHEELARTCLWFRGEELVVGGPATTENPYATAHCMRLGDVYFHGYELSEYTKSYRINIKLSKGSESEEFELTPTDPVVVLTDGAFNFTAELLGDLDEYQGALELDNYILYIPSAPDTHPMVEDYQNNMLLVPREEVSRDGGEPDKVGVSFHTFRRLGSEYSVSEAGDGLHNQLFHKHNADLQKLVLNPNAECTYLVHGKRDFKGSMTFKAGMDKALKHKVNDINYSLISLTMDYAEIKDIDTQSIGIIKEAYVKTFTSMTEEGKMVVVISNEGDYPTDYIVTVTKCTMNIRGTSCPTGALCWAIPAQARSLNPGKEVTLEFDVFTRYNLDTSNECLVTLKSPTGKKYDSVWVVFDTKKHKSKYSWELQQKNEASELTPAGTECPNQPPDCSNAAPSVQTIWPANNKFVPVNITGVSDPDGDPVTITITSIMQDEPVDTVGDGQFVPDGKGIGTDTAEVRAERSGTRKVPGNGRVYTIGFTASDGKGGECSGTVKVGVPHDVEDTPLDDGALYDSTAGE